MHLDVPHIGTDPECIQNDTRISTISQPNSYSFEDTLLIFAKKFLQHPSDVPDDFDPMYFENELERQTGFLLLQSSMFYLFWMAYENERDVNWKSIDPFPFPKYDELEKVEDQIEKLSNELWNEMSSRWKGGSREMIKKAGALKPITDEIDNLLGPLMGLTENEIEYVKGYDEMYRLSEVSEDELVEFELEGVTAELD